MGRAFPGVVAALLLSAAPGVAPSLPAPEGKGVTVVFRLDDCSARSDTALEAGVLRAFRARNLRVTVGVVPRIAARSVYDSSPREGMRLPPEKIELLRGAVRDGTAEVAQHGYSHQTVPLRIFGRAVPLSGRFHSEFFGVERARQKERIARGKAILESALQVRVETFIPPWNGYDANTLSVLEELGFLNFSAARMGAAPPASSLRFLPWTCELADLPAAVESARKVEEGSPVIVALIHPSDFRESGAAGARMDLSSLAGVLAWISVQPGVRVMTLSEAGSSTPGLDSARFARNRNALLWSIAPPLLGRFIAGETRYLYLSPSVARRFEIRLWTAVLSFYLGLAGMASAVTLRILRRVSSRLPRTEGWAAWWAPAALLAAAAFALRGGMPHAGGASSSFFMAGACLGAWWNARPGRKRSERGAEPLQDL